MAHTTAIDILAAKLTGIDLAKKHSASALLDAHLAHPEVLALREGFLAAACNEICAANTAWLVKGVR